jgi:hypothetical protein
VYDPDAVQRRYAAERARRNERIRRVRARRYARLRFFVVLVALLALSGYLGVMLWREIQRLFGL